MARKLLKISETTLALIKDALFIGWVVERLGNRVVITKAGMLSGPKLEIIVRDGNTYVS